MTYSPYASKRLRALAWTIDSVLLAMLTHAGATVGAIFAHIFGQAHKLSLSMSLGGSFWFLATVIINQCVAPGLLGQTLGKRWMGLKIVDARSGQLIGLRRGFFRNSVQLEVWSLLALGFLISLVDGKNRTLTDKLSHTVVIKHDAVYPEHWFVLAAQKPQDPRKEIKLPWAA